MASRLQQHFPQLVHLDQVRFLPTLEAHTPCVFLGTDAKKAFDQVKLAVYSHGFALHWDRRPYAPMDFKHKLFVTALVKANGVLSEPFSIVNGTRQGCPLLPLLFALTFETFLCRTCLNLNIMGPHIGDSQHKVSAYADNLLFSLTNPSISLPNLLRKLDLYGALSNLKINFIKSEMMGVAISQSRLPNLRLHLKFKWMDFGSGIFRNLCP